MAVLTAGPGQQFSTIASAVAASHDGDTIYVRAGTYLDDYFDITTKITIVGVGGMVHLISDQLIPNDEAYVRVYTDGALDHFEFSGATVSPARANGSGIRFVHGNLTITNSYFHDNEEGIRSGADTGSIVIDRSEFAHNGSGNGQTHNIYIGRIASLTVTNSYLHDAVTGHELKSRAAQTIVSDNRIFDNLGNASYSIDLPVGGVGTIQNNIIQQGPNSPNGTIIAYAAEDVPAPGSSLLVSHNAIINQLQLSTPYGVRNFSTDVIAQIQDNQIYGLDSASIAKGPNAQSGNQTITSAPALDVSHPWDASPWDDLISGGDTDDTLTGVAGQNRLLVGGSGNDLFHIAAGEANVTIADFVAGDVVNLDGYGFTDVAALTAAMIQTGADVVLNLGNGETLTFLNRQIGNFAANDFVFTGSPPPPTGTVGSPLNDLIGGTANADVLDGLAGSDTMDGGAGDDSYIVDNSHDEVRENTGAGADRVTTSLNAYALPENVEVLLFGGSGGFTGTGNSENNAITGLSGDDSLDGRVGNDTLTGGPGNDTYMIDSTGDLMIESPGNGIDSVATSLNSYVLLANFENLVFAGSGAFTGIGNSDNNDITAGPENDSLDGLSGADTMRGGLGDDSYFVDDPADLVKEIQNGGTDTIFTTLTNYTVAKYTENLIHIGNSSFTGIGSTGNNVLSGSGGNDSLNALSGNDTLAGLGGADTLDGGAGVDTTSYALSPNGVNVSLSTGQNFGSDAQGDTLLNIENLTGSGFDDTLEGNAANNSLDGGAGTDTVSYEHAAAAVKVSLASTSSQTTGGVGSDKLFQFENLIGSNFADSLSGSRAANVLTGLAGNDTLLGGLGADTLIGGAGNDLFIVDNAADVAAENANEGTDTVQTSVTFTLGDNIETLVQTGSAAINATGDNGANSLSGNSKGNLLTGLDGNDTLSGLAGNDTLVGGAGLDVLTGGTGADRFTFTSADVPSGGAVIGQITDFLHSQTDKIDLSAIDANGSPGSAFAFPGGSPNGVFTHQAGQLHYVANGSGGVNVEGDIDGDATADFIIAVQGVASLVASDFVL